MFQEIKNSDILQAVIELSGEVKGVSRQQDEMQTELKGLSQRQDEMQTELKGFSQILTGMDKRLNEKVDIVNAKIDIVSNRLLETQAEVNLLKSAK